MTSADRLPEQMHWTDDGCTIAPHCLSCPLPTCRYDMRGKEPVGAKNALEFSKLQGKGLTIDELAARLGVTRRTIFRLQRSSFISLYQTPPQS